jgi:(5-formylfuran-3-yl)methyl phosphate synthase
VTKKGQAVIPELLVSVRNASEAGAAFEGGADVIDIKEPESGPLGRAKADVVNDICLHLSRIRCSTPVSLALGEVSEWNGTSCEDQCSVVRQVTSLNSPVRFLKVGLSGTGISETPSSGQSVFSRWAALRARVAAAASENQPVSEMTKTPAVDPFSSTPGCRWIGVAYADFSRCGAPTPAEVINEAARAGCYGVLIDTFLKDGSGLLNWMSSADLSAVREQCDRNHLILALAGQVKLRHLNTLAAVRPDIVAVRGSVCESGDRHAEVSATLVRQFREMLRQVS